MIFIAYLLAPLFIFADIPDYFQDVKKEIPTIEIDIRYSTKFNFLGKPVKGYQSNTCYLHKKLVEKLKLVQSELKTKKLSLKIYDCYRPQKAVDQFYRWAVNSENITMKKSFFPNINKSDLFKKKYLAKKSKHSRGLAVDLTLVKIKDSPSIIFLDSPQKNCTRTSQWPQGENTLEMGTTYDCLDIASNTHSTRVSQTARANRLILKKYMEKYGFKNYSKEWWHYSLPGVVMKTYHNFDIQ